MANTYGTGSTLYRQLSNYIAGYNPYYALYMPGAITWWVAPSTYAAAANGTVSSDGNSGETPMDPLATLSQAHTRLTANRGDTVVLLPGTYTLSSTMAWTKSGCRLVSAIPYAANVVGDGVITTLMTLNAVSDMEIAGIRFTQATALIAGLGIATVGSAACNRVRIHHCQFIGGAVASATAIVNGQNQAGNDAFATEISDCLFNGWSTAAIITYGGLAQIVHNTIRVSTAASSTGIVIGDQGAAFTRDCLVIERNVFIAGSDALARTSVTIAGIEANTQMYALEKNDFCGLAGGTVQITANIHPEGVGVNYQGQATTTNPALVQG